MYCSGVLQWCIAVMYCSGVGQWCTAVVYCSGVLQWCTAVVYCNGVLHWCIAVVHRSGRAGWVNFPGVLHRCLSPRVAQAVEHPTVGEAGRELGEQTKRQAQLACPQQPTDKLVIALLSVRAVLVPACPPDMSPPSMNIPSLFFISASSCPWEEEIEMHM